MLFFLISYKQIDAKCTVIGKEFRLPIPAITIQPNTPVGTVLARINFPIDPEEIYAHCDEDGGIIKRWASTYENYSEIFPATDYYEIYDSEGHLIEGLQAKITDWSGRPINDQSVKELYQNHQEVKFINGESIQIEFIKTGTLKPGKRKFGNVSLIISEEGEQQRRYQRIYTAQGGTDFVVLPSCQLIYPQNIDLGKVASDALNPDSPIAKHFTLNFECSGNASISLEMMSPYADKNQHGILNNALKTSHSAKGVGVQILDDNDKPIVFDTPKHFQYLAQNTPSQLSYYARLYRVYEKITPGQIQTYIHLIVKYK